LKLVRIRHLGPHDLARVNQHALAIDQRGRATNTLYAQTLPAS